MLGLVPGVVKTAGNGRRRRTRKGFAVALSAAMLILGLAAPVRADTIPLTGSATGAFSTATAVCEFNAQTNTFTFTITNTSAITQPGSTSTITGIGFDLPPLGNASPSGLNGFTGAQAPSLSSNFAFSDADIGSVSLFPAAVLDFGFITGLAGTFASGSPNDGLLPGESASFTVSGAAFAGFTEEQICNAIFVRFQNINTGTVNDVAAGPGAFVYQADARIKRSGGPLRGNDMYNTTGEGQTVALTPPGGSLRRVYVTVQNDGNTPDSFSLETTGTVPTGYQLRYFRGRSNVELTAAVESDTLVTPVLAPGEVYRIRVRVVTTTLAEHGSEVTQLFTFTSESDSGAQDAVLLTVSRR